MNTEGIKKGIKELEKKIKQEKKITKACIKEYNLYINEQIHILMDLLISDKNISILGLKEKFNIIRSLFKIPYRLKKLNKEIYNSYTLANELKCERNILVAYLYEYNDSDV